MTPEVLLSRFLTTRRMMHGMLTGAELSQLEVMIAISRGYDRVCKIARLTHMHRVTVSQYLIKLEEDGKVTHILDKDGKVTNQLSLTPQGNAYLEKHVSRLWTDLTHRADVEKVPTKAFENALIVIMAVCRDA